MNFSEGLENKEAVWSREKGPQTLDLLPGLLLTAHVTLGSLFNLLVSFLICKVCRLYSLFSKSLPT